MGEFGKSRRPRGLGSGPALNQTSEFGGARRTSQMRPADHGVTFRLQSLELTAVDINVDDPPGTPIGNILGISKGSTVRIISPDDGRFQLVNNQLLAGYGLRVVGPVRVRIREENRGAENSPKTSVFDINVTTEFESGYLPSLQFDDPLNSQYIGQVI